MAVHQAPGHVRLSIIIAGPWLVEKSAHGHYEVFNTVTLIGSLLVSQGQKGANNMCPLKTITRGSEPLPSTEGSGGKASQSSAEGSGGEAGQPSAEGNGGEKVRLCLATGT